MMITDSGVFSPLASTGFLSVFHFLTVYIRPFCQSLWPLCHYRIFFGYEPQIVRRVLHEPPSSAVRSRGPKSGLQHCLPTNCLPTHCLPTHYVPRNCLSANLLANSPPMNFIDPMSPDELLAVTELLDTSRRFDDSL